MAVPATHNIVVYQGDDYEMWVQVALRTDPNDEATESSVDVTDYTGRAQVRRTPRADAAAVWIVTIPDTPEKPAAEGWVHLLLPGTESAKISGSGVWDFELVGPDGQTQTWMAGHVRLRPQVTR